MKKSILSLVVALVAMANIVGCSKMWQNGPSENYLTLYMLTKMESRDQKIGATPVTSTYTYKQIEGKQPDPNQPLHFSAIPKLVNQTIVGDTLKQITYSYNTTKKTLTATRYATNGTVWIDSLGLNEQGMASTVLREGQAPTPYSISYLKDNFLRQTVGNISLVVGQDPSIYTGEVYRSATVAGEVVAEYFYKTLPNLIQLQQYTIPGEPYYWVTDHFGRQSPNLLDHALVKEDGVKVRYDFSYTLNAQGFVVDEMIKRNSVLFRVNSYFYTTGIVTL